MSKKRSSLIYLIALWLTSHSLQAASLDLQQYQGKVVYLDFWASWCVPCKHSFPWMNRMQGRFANDGLVVIAVNLDEDRSQAEQFLREHPAQFKIIFDPEGKLAETYKVQGMPSSYLFDRNGKLIYSHIGFKEREANVLTDKIEFTLKP